MDPKSLNKALEQRSRLVNRPIASLSNILSCYLDLPVGRERVPLKADTRRCPKIHFAHLERAPIRKRMRSANAQNTAAGGLAYYCRAGAMLHNRGEYFRRARSSIANQDNHWSCKSGQ